MRRRLPRWRNMPPTMPGTPATLSRKMNRINFFFVSLCFRDMLHRWDMAYPLSLGEWLLSLDGCSRLGLVGFLITVHTCGLVHTISGKADNFPGCIVANCPGRSMSGFDRQHFIICVAFVWSGRLGLLDMWRLFDRKEVTKLVCRCR